MDKIISEINKAWKWKGFIASEILRVNEFGNVIFKTDKNGYWRLCPEEFSCVMIAQKDSELKILWNDEEFVRDWEMTNLVNIAKSELGELAESQKYCLKIPGVIGGKYEKENLGKINFMELKRFGLVTN